MALKSHVNESVSLTSSHVLVTTIVDLLRVIGLRA
jgi:hypothetical protein